MKPAQRAAAVPRRTNVAPLRANSRNVLRSVADIRRYFYRNQRPIFFVGPTNFNLLGLERWCGNFHHVNYIDCFDGADPSVFVPSKRPHAKFASIEDVNNHLMEHPEVAGYLHAFGEKPVVVLLMFDGATERLARHLGVDIWFPPAALRQSLDNKINTVRLGNAAGVASVPNVLARIDSYAELRKSARRLGHDLVVQTAFGDSGHTTFFVSSEADFARHAKEIRGAGEVKVMRRIDCHSAAVEGCVTRHGTIVGPLVTELVGVREATPFRGGWCGNELVADRFGVAVRDRARAMTARLGDKLAQLGYRGYFEVDYLIDAHDANVYLGELNPRITGISPLTNMAAFAHADAPLFLFHMLEFSGVDYELDVGEINDRWGKAESVDDWSHLVLKSTATTSHPIARAPASGVWRRDPATGRIALQRHATLPHGLQSADEAFFMRISGSGDWIYEGADLGILFARGPWLDDAFALTARGRQWADGIVGAYGLSAAMPQPPATLQSMYLK